MELARCLKQAFAKPTFPTGPKFATCRTCRCACKPQNRVCTAKAFEPNQLSRANHDAGINFCPRNYTIQEIIHTPCVWVFDGFRFLLQYFWTLLETSFFGMFNRLFEIFCIFERLFLVVYLLWGDEISSAKRRGPTTLFLGFFSCGASLEEGHLLGDQSEENWAIRKKSWAAYYL